MSLYGCPENSPSLPDAIKGEVMDIAVQLNLRDISRHVSVHAAAAAAAAGVHHHSQPLLGRHNLIHPKRQEPRWIIPGRALVYNKIVFYYLFS